MGHQNHTIYTCHACKRSLYLCWPSSYLHTLVMSYRPVMKRRYFCPENRDPGRTQLKSPPGERKKSPFQAKSSISQWEETAVYPDHHLEAVLSSNLVLYTFTLLVYYTNCLLFLCLCCPFFFYFFLVWIFFQVYMYLAAYSCCF